LHRHYSGDLSAESNPTTQVGTTKKRMVPGRRRKRKSEDTEHSLYNIKAASGPSEERLKSQQSYTVSVP